MTTKSQRKKLSSNEVGYVCNTPLVHAFRGAEKKYKRYKNEPQPLNFSQVVDFSKSVPRDGVVLLKEHTILDKSVYVLDNYPGFIFVPNALGIEDQVAWHTDSITEFMHVKRTNLKVAPQKVTSSQVSKAKRQGDVADNPNNTISPYLDPYCTSGIGLEKLRWATLGCSFDWTTRTYVDVNDDRDGNFPQALASLCEAACSSLGYHFTTTNGVSSTVNYYKPKDVMCGHVDNAENDLLQPLISFSTGHSCIFLLGKENQDTEPIPIFIRSGDLMILSGPSRNYVHGVPRILENTISDDFQERVRRSLLDYNQRIHEICNPNTDPNPISNLKEAQALDDPSPKPNVYCSNERNEREPDSNSVKIVPQHVIDYACNMRLNINVRYGLHL